MDNQNFETADSINTKLVSSTYLDDIKPDSPYYWIVKTYDYSHSYDSEVSFIKCNKGKKFFRRKKDDDLRSTMTREDIQRANSRAKTMVRRKIMTMGADHLLTVTFKDNVTDPKYAWRCWSQFVRKIKDRFPKYHYVVVAEYQKRGAIHFHAAVKGYQNVRYLRQCWYSIVGEGNGSINIAYKGEYRPHQIAGYLTKYITKEFESDSKKGLHRYRASLGIKPHATTKYLPPVLGSAFYIIRDFFEDWSGKTAQSTFISPQNELYGWAATW